MEKSKLRLGHWKIPSSAKGWEELLSQQQENSSASGKKNLEQPEPTDKYEIRFVKNPKR